MKKSIDSADSPRLQAGKGAADGSGDDSRKGRAGEKPSPYPALRHPGFRRFLFPNFFFLLFRQGLVAAVAWQVYIWTNSAAAIGFIGFINVIPLFLFVLPSGVLADRFDRRRINTITMGFSCIFSVLLVLCSQFHGCIPGDNALLATANDWIRRAALFFTDTNRQADIHFDNPALPIIFVLQFLQASARVIGNPARAALIPQLVSHRDIPNAFILHSTAFELSATIGPPVGGLIAGLTFGGAGSGTLLTGFTIVYALDAFFCALLAVVFACIKLAPAEATNTADSNAKESVEKSEKQTTEEKQLDSTQERKTSGDNTNGAPAPGALAGIRFIWNQKPVLAAITLDLFAVLLGGVVALYPIFAVELAAEVSQQPVVMGLMRGALPFGAFIMALIVVRMPAFKRPGWALLWSVIGFGISLLVFALSRNLILSLVALFFSGMCDNVSVVIRHTLVQMLTPNQMRGRVTAVNQLFIGSSNEISEFRGGLMAASFGARAAASIGALCILGVTASVALLFPSLRHLAPLKDLKTAKD